MGQITLPIDRNGAVIRIGDPNLPLIIYGNAVSGIFLFDVVLGKNIQGLGIQLIDRIPRSRIAGNEKFLGARIKRRFS